jgi:formamidopyrimidine-DNA glycosylase
MPELPEVETVMRGLEQAVRGALIEKVDQRRKDLRVPFPANLKKKVEGRTIDRFARRAKYVLMHLDDGQVMVLHLGMSGRILIARNHTPEKHDHLILHMRDGTQVIFNDARRFGLVYLMSESDMEKHTAFKGIGPEPLGNDFSGPVLEERLKGKKISIKQALLDQRIVAGVGNIYASEALFESGISPKRAAGKVQGERAEKLSAAIRSVLTRAIAAGGSSLKDHRQVNGELGYFQHGFKAYDRAGEPCPVCACGPQDGGVIKKIVQGGRSTFYCPRHQK